LVRYRIVTTVTVCSTVPLLHVALPRTFMPARFVTCVAVALDGSARCACHTTPRIGYCLRLAAWFLPPARGLPVSSAACRSGLVAVLVLPPPAACGSAAVPAGAARSRSAGYLLRLPVSFCRLAAGYLARYRVRTVLRTYAFTDSAITLRATRTIACRTLLFTVLF